MKGFLIWFMSTIFGALLGYGLALYLEYNTYLIAAVGAIIGSSLGITIILQQRKGKGYISTDSEIDTNENSDLS